ncbi:MAG: hypothetical protein M3Q88_00370 [Pseudomonadota bacterium]|nr:hypothetical protein [Pseudomonadota bacterium]
MADGISIGVAWTGAAAFVRREKKLLAPLVLALMVLPVTVSQLVQPTNPFASSGGIKPWMVIAIISLLAGLVGQMAISRLAMGWEASLGAALRLAARRLPTTVAAFILFFLCVGLVVIPLTMVLMIAGGGADRASAGSGAANAMTLLAIFAAVPRIMLSPVIAMNESTGPWGLVKRSWRASRGQYWRLLGFFIMVLIASLILAIAASSVVGSLAALLIGPSNPLTISRLLVALTGGMVQAVIATIYAAMIGRIVAQLARGRPTSGM